MTTVLGSDVRAYNACVQALNECDEALAELAKKRDNVWVASDAICHLSRQGRAHLPRNVKITNGSVQR